MKEKFLRVTGRNFVAGAFFARTVGGWRLAEAAPILRWMRNVKVSDMARELERRGCRWEWL